MSKRIIDAHQHVWKCSEREYSWITPDIQDLLGHDYVQEDVKAIKAGFGITDTVYVQAADTYEDTFYMLHSATANPEVTAVVGWVPLDRPEEAAAALELFTRDKRFKGIRNLTHDYSNPKYDNDDQWILRDPVLKTLGFMEKLGLAFDYVAVKPEHTANIPILAAKFPQLRIVIDHFAKPNIKEKQWEDWRTEMRKAAQFSNVYTKFSGLNVLSDWEKWTISDWRPYLHEMLDAFSSSRIMTGSDWPFSSMANDFATVWSAQQELIAELSPADQENILSTSAIAAYRM